MSGSKSIPTIGFLTALEHPQLGVFGGYLVLNLGGRPLEFHCTAPLKPNRAQQILYGPTLEPYVYGELIGQTLLEKAAAPALVVLTDEPSMLAVRQHTNIPTALVLPGDPQRRRIDPAHGKPNPSQHFQLGRNHLGVEPRFTEDARSIVDRLADLDDAFDLAEPFVRVREALKEAQQGA